MADLTITTTSVLPGSVSKVLTGTAGATITAGKVVYLDPISGKWKLADSDSATVIERQAGGISLNSASDGQPLSVLIAGDITINATLTAGMDYYLSSTPGGICPRADIGAGESVCLLGLAKSTTVLAVDIQFPNVSL